MFVLLRTYSEDIISLICFSFPDSTMGSNSYDALNSPILFLFSDVFRVLYSVIASISYHSILSASSLRSILSSSEGGVIPASGQFS